MDDSIFVTDDRTTPLLHGYEPLQEDVVLESDGGLRWAWSSEDTGTTEGFGGIPEFIPDAGNPGTKYQSVENTLHDIYRYYWLRGLWKFVMAELGHLIIMTWLVLFCVFLGSCVDYRGIMLFHPGGHPNGTGVPAQEDAGVWRYVHFGGGISWYFVVSLVIYGIYAAWRVVRFLRDLRRLVRVRVFYRDVLKMTDFNLRTARWAEVLERLPQVHADQFEILRVRDGGRMRQVCQHPRAISAMVTKRENAFKRLLELGVVDFVFRIPTSRLRCLQWQDAEIAVLTRGLRWNLIHCVVNFFFDADMRLRTQDEPRATQITRLKKRVAVLAIANVLLLPFLVVFIVFYAVFRYGEQFYKDPSSVGARQWSPMARWYFRDFNEMPHVFEERLRLSSRFAKHYTKQFAAGALEGLARAAAFILGSIVVWLLTLSFINEHVLLSLDITPGKSVLWWITVLSGGWVLCRSLLQSQHVFYPRDALNTVHHLVRHLPPDLLDNPGSRQTLTQFYRLFPLRVTVLLREFAGLLVTPWIMLARIYPQAEAIVDAFEQNTAWDELRGHYMKTSDLEEGGDSNDVPLDFDERSVLQSAHLVPYLQNLDTAALRVEESI